MPKKSNKIEVSWEIDHPLKAIDFGLFPAHKKNKVKVEKHFWEQYVDARAEFEQMHDTLVDLIKR